MKLQHFFWMSICAVAGMLVLNACEESKKQTDMSENNPVIENMMARRSIRKYLPEAVARETMETILNCGINAPNGQNKQSWEIRVVDDAETMDAIVAAMAKANPEVPADMIRGCFRGAPTMVFIANDLSYDFSVIDCGLLSENMMLSAWSLGVGSICLGSPIRFLNNVSSVDPIWETLGFSNGYRPVICIGFGYADEAPAAKPRNPEKYRFVSVK